MDITTLRRPRTVRPLRPLTGRSAIVTGSTSGIGLGIARALAESGADIMLNGFGAPASINALCDELAEANGITVCHHSADMSRPAEIEAMVAAGKDAFGSIDVLVNNAGIQHVAPIEAFPADKWQAVLAINLSAAFFAMRAVISSMKAHGWGRIVNVASAHGLVASPFKSAYVAAKHGMVGLTKVAAIELGESGVTCNAICPGYVWTPLVEKQIAEQAAAHGIAPEAVIRDVLLKNQPNKRFATVEEIGAVAVFLCTEGAASITGVALPVDGGWTAH